jgi:hypothetical protein
MHDILLILVIALLWLITGVLVGLGLESLTGNSGLLLPCGTLNIAIGMMLLQLATRSEAGRRLFYEGRKEEDYLNLGLAALWGLPVIMALAGLLWWLMGKLFPP